MLATRPSGFEQASGASGGKGDPSKVLSTAHVGCLFSGVGRAVPAWVAGRRGME